MRKTFLRIWKDSVWGNIIATIIIAIVPLLYNYILSLKNQTTLFHELNKFLDIKINLWLILVFVILILIYLGTKRFISKSKKFTYDNETLKLDQRTYLIIKNELIDSGTIYNFRSHMFSRGSFKSDNILFLEFVAFKCKDPEFEFFNPKLEKLKVNLIESLYYFEKILGENIFDAVKDDYLGVPREWEINRRLKALSDIKTTELNIIKSYDTLIRNGREILKI